MRQLISPNPHIPCKPGWCLAYVNEAFGVRKVYGTATGAWLGSSTKHRDYNFPEGVWFPVWFSLAGEPAGHVALVAPDGSVFSTSDLSTVPHHHPDLADLIRYYARYGMTLTYLGWTEDVEGTPVIGSSGLAAQGTITPIASEEFDIMTATPEEQDAFIKRLLNYQVDGADGAKATLGALVQEFRQQHKDEIRVIEDVPDKVLDTHIPRGGVMGGETTLRASLSWGDQHVIDIISAVAGAAANDGASVEEIKSAVKSAIAESVVKVDVTVAGGQ